MEAINPATLADAETLEPDELLPHERDAFLAEVRRVIEATVQQGNTSLGEIAMAVGVSERTLQRRLANGKTSFRRVVDSVRYDRAMALLTGSSAKVFEIAVVLGFRNKQSFHWAFRRWTGTTPRSVSAAQDLGLFPQDQDQKASTPPPSDEEQSTGRSKPKKKDDQRAA
jgi:transcriptional regulator GlxA family with amidase domain